MARYPAVNGKDVGSSPTLRAALIVQLEDQSASIRQVKVRVFLRAPIFVLVVQRIGLQPTKLLMKVRFLPRTRPCISMEE